MGFGDVFESIKDTVMGAVYRSIGEGDKQNSSVEKEVEVLERQSIEISGKMKNASTQNWISYCTSIVTNENKMDLAINKLLWIHVFLFENGVLFFRNVHSDDGTNTLVAHLTPTLPPIIGYRMEETPGGLDAAYQHSMYLAQNEIDEGRLPEKGWSFAVEYSNGFIMIYEEGGFMHCAYTKKKLVVIPTKLDCYS